MHKLKTLAKRGSAFAGAVGLLAGIGTSALPAFASADALNPLTERSLTLSSSSPGWSYLDGSGNTTYAPPNSGANGQKTGDTFSFRVTSDSSTTKIKALTFQYCTSAAGDCTAPGNNAGDPSATVNDTTTTSDLNVVTSSPSLISSADWTSTLASASKTPPADNSKGNFVVLYHTAASAPASWSDYTYTDATDWAMSASKAETPADVTGKKNQITITSATGQALSPGDYVKVIFFGTNTNYITNPGQGSFFVRINDYNSDTTLDSTTLVDGGVTVANMMNQSISIQTKVLETMAFSVGVHDPDTDDIAGGGADYTTNTGLSQHGMCDAVLTRPNPAATPATYDATPENVLQLGNASFEHSLSTDTAYDVNSYWRLSSNSSGGATVYYTGHTLTNTEGDEISPLTDGGTGTSSQTGTEQFGLGIAHDSDTSISALGGSDALPVSGDTYDSAFNTLVSGNPDIKYHKPRLWPLVPTAPYGSAAGTLTTATPKFSFNANADTYAIPIATESTDVVNCVTAKMRYMANIAATTPAGIYTTKVNYVAAPQY